MRNLDEPISNNIAKALGITAKVLIFLKICFLAWPSETLPPTPRNFGDPDPGMQPLMANRTSDLVYHNLAEKQVSADTYFWLSSPKPANKQFLCQLNIDRRCSNVDPAEVVELMLALHILYTPIQDYLPLLYNYTLWFRDYMESYGITTVIMESIRTDMPQRYVATDPNRKKPREIQITNDENFYKRENLLNVALKLVPDIEYEYILWIDAHQVFLNPYWWLETIVKCEKYASVQLFQEVAYIGSNTSIAYTTPSFNYVTLWEGGVQEGIMVVFGNAWAVRRELYVAIGGILDTCVVSFCDGYYGLAGNSMDLHDYILTQYEDSDDIHRVEDWILKARGIFQNKRTTVRGRLLHFYHERIYKYKMVMKYFNQYDDRYNLKRDIQRDTDLTLKTVNPDLNAFWKIMTVYTHYMEPIG